MEFEYLEERIYNNVKHIVSISLSFDPIKSIYYIFVDILHDNFIVYFIDFAVKQDNSIEISTFKVGQKYEFDPNIEAPLIINKFKKLKAFI